MSEHKFYSIGEGGSKMRNILFTSVFVLLVGLLLIGCATTTHNEPTASIPLPQNMNIITPDSTLSPQIRDFSGKWVGKWDVFLDHILVVEEISPPNAKVIYAYGKSVEWNIWKPSFSRVQSHIEPGILTLTFGSTMVTYRLQSDGTLSATYENSRGKYHATMRKIDQ